MAVNSQYSTTARDVQLNGSGLLAAMASGLVRIYDGSQPANANTGITTQNKLAEFTLGNPAGTETGGVITANAITPVAALQTGTASWFRVLKSDGSTVLFDGSIGTSGCNLNLNSVAIQANAQVSISSLTLTAAAAGT